MIHEKFSTPELSNSLEDYIEAVRNIELEKGCATVGEIAEALNVKKPSASLAMKQLKERGLVEYTQYSPIVLTREGRYYADRVISCHTMDKNRESDLHIKRIAQMKAMEAYQWDTEDFIREFGRNYLED